tara:strand:+ start:2496 stop:2831 length:336 start_codon:yes stop_codon:yes gene_type:complete
MLFGLEVATGAVSVVVVRLWAGLTASLTGSEFVVSGPRYLTGVLLILTGGVMFWADRFREGIWTKRSACPNCGVQTRRVKRRRWDRILPRILKIDVTRQSCMRCGWSGLST